MFKQIYLWWKERNFLHLRKKQPGEVFSEIYKNNTWGGEQGSFYSGAGSANPATALYIEKVIDFIQQRDIQSVLDIGCGDFKIMSKVLTGVKVKYTGADVVAELINYNSQTYRNETTFFIKLNCIEDALPMADLVIIRQVLQHLSNAHIQKILMKLSSFKYALITEHIPIADHVEFNLDKITGPHIRMRVNSGVFIDKPPFNVSHAKILFEYREDDRVKGKLIPAVIRTYLVEN